ncbi:hypothetical protein NW762_003079 [Fusarium torreyae]|uniref:Uncharacterized protein n=1 Tax=Fusarium torreyae TaxID=1237075 RepID=A0A9W8SCK2_9HYPO|nr:hypothetical protein NW762_003079 [Fusarium torreyae]
MTTLAPKEFLEALKSRNATSDWDVLVSYSEKQLNDLLSIRWKRSMESVDLPFSVKIAIGNDGSYLQNSFEVRLGAPALSFETTTGRATLSFPIEGGYKSTVFLKGMEPIDKGSKTITPKAYVVDVSVPMVHMVANVNEKLLAASTSSYSDDLRPENATPVILEHDQELKFGDKGISSSHITFHFDNKKVTAKTRNITGKELEEDGMLTDTADPIANHLKDEKKVKWIEHSIAIVTDREDPAGHESSSLLRPVKCMFNTQPGVLNIFIKVKGGTSTNPTIPPVFQHKGPVGLLPFPSGTEASIIISRYMLINDFLLPNLRKFCKELKSERPIEVSKPASGSGLKLNLRLEEDKTFNFHKVSSGWNWNEFTVKNYKVDFTKNPLYAIVDTGTDGVTPQVTWKWSFHQSLDWRRDVVTVPGRQGRHEVTVGRAKLEANMPKTSRPFAAINDESLNITLSFEDPADEPTLTFTPEERDVPWGENAKLVIGIPAELKELRMALTPFAMSFPKLDFFETQNVFAPGTRFITAKNVLFPDDLVLTGMMARAGDEEKPDVSTGDEVAYSSFISGPEGSSVSVQASPLRPLLDRLYSNNRFLGALSTMSQDGEPQGVVAWLKQQGFAISNDDLKALDAMRTPGPDFDVRFAGGAYKLKAQGLDYQTLFIHCVTRKVYIDGIEAVSKPDEATGKLLVTTGDGKQCFSLEFEVKESMMAGFQGTSWMAEDKQKTSPISGEIFYPWDDATGDQEGSPVEQLWVKEAKKYYAVSLDLTTPLQLPLKEFVHITRAESLFEPASVYILAPVTPPQPALPPSMWKDIPGLIEYPFTAPYRVYKFFQGISKRKAKKLLDKYADLVKLLIANEPIPENVLDEFHNRLEREVNEALRDDKFSDKTAAEIRQLLEKKLRNSLEQSVEAVSLRNAVEQMDALRTTRPAEIDGVVKEAVKKRLDEDIDKANFEPYIENMILSRRAEINYEKAMRDAEAYKEAAEQAKTDYAAHEASIREKQETLDRLRRELGDRNPTPEQRRTMEALKLEIQRLTEKKTDEERKQAESEEKEREKREEGERETETKESRDREAEYHRRMWLRERERSLCPF